MKRALLLLIAGCATTTGDPSTERRSAPHSPDAVASPGPDAGARFVTPSASPTIDVGGRPGEPPTVDIEVPLVPVPRPDALHCNAIDDEPPDAGASSTPDAGAVEPEQPAPETPAPTTATLDAGAPPTDSLPRELREHEEQLEANGYAPCPDLAWAVERCCAQGSAFTCSGNSCPCEGTLDTYPAAAALCTIAPATPLRWVCPE